MNQHKTTTAGSIDPPFWVRTAGSTAHWPHSTLGTHDDDIMLTVFLSGRGVYRNSSVKIDIIPPMVGLVTPDDPGILMADLTDPYTHYYCRFNGQYAKQLANQALKIHEKCFFTCEFADQISDCIHRMGPIAQTRQTSHMGPPELLLAEVLIKLAKLAKNVYPTLTIGSVERYLQEHLSEPHSLDDMASFFSMSKSSLCRRVKQLTGQTILNLSEKTKIQWAKTLLKLGSDNISEVALRLGYNDPFYFSRVFKKHLGKSPRAYQKDHRTSG